MEQLENIERHLSFTKTLRILGANRLTHFPGCNLIWKLLTLLKETMNFYVPCDFKNLARL